MDQRQLQKLQSDPSAFRASLRIDADGIAKPLGKCLDPWQQADFAALDPAWQAVVGHSQQSAIQRAWLERPRGHSKTQDIAVSVLWALFASRRSLVGVAASGDKDQAGLLRDACDRLCRLNPWLSAVLEVQASKVANKHTGSELRILTSDAPTSYGLTPDFIVADEITHWAKRDLWNSLLSSAAKRRHCLLLVISNAGFGDSWQWETRQAVQSDRAWYFSRLDGPQASWITADRLAEQRRLLPDIAYRRLWENQWTTGSGDALREDDIARSLTLTGPTHEPESGWAYVGGLDLGLSKDASAFAVIAKHIGYHQETYTPAKLTDRQRMLVEAGLMRRPKGTTETIAIPATNRIKLVQLHLWRPSGDKRVDLSEVEETIVATNQRFGLSLLGADPWQASYLVTRTSSQGVPTVSVDFTGMALRSMCACVLESFGEGLIDLYHNRNLLADLRALRVEERAYGVRLTSPRGPNGHGDSATALAIALHVAKDIHRRTPARVGRPLITWP